MLPSMKKPSHKSLFTKVLLIFIKRKLPHEIIARLVVRGSMLHTMI
jgi:hypothetical protein